VSSKLEEGLAVNPNKHYVLWCLGNALTLHAILDPDQVKAKVHFDKAVECFKQIANEELLNELHRKLLEMAAKAPEIHAEIHKHGLGQESAGTAVTSSGTKVKSGRLVRGPVGQRKGGGSVMGLIFSSEPDHCEPFQTENIESSHEGQSRPNAHKEGLKQVTYLGLVRALHSLEDGRKV
ncbi:mitochondrial-like import receptor subunit TOM20-like, partial [Trifolium medium]|nr:mitochondrial-like import receptor subunit TOM20-like [Trifolium medium]